MLSSLSGFSFQHQNNSQSPMDLSGPRNAGEALLQGFAGAGHIIFTKLYQRQRQVILVVVGVPADRATKNLCRPRSLTHMGVDVAQQGYERVVPPTLRRYLLDRVECLRIEALPE